MKLYGIPMSNATARALTCLYEKGVDFEFVPVDFFAAAEHKQPSFLAKNPFGQIPVLEDGDLTLFESRAITEYISRKFKDQATDLIRRDNFEESALVSVWTQVESHQFYPVVFPIYNQFVLAPLFGEQTDQAIIDENLVRLGKVLDVYEERLGKTKYLAGDFYSLADLNHLPLMFYFINRTPWAHVVNDRPNVKAWWEDISSRDAFKKVAKGMTLGAK